MLNDIHEIKPFKAKRLRAGYWEYRTFTIKRVSSHIWHVRKPQYETLFPVATIKEAKQKIDAFFADENRNYDLTTLTPR